MRVSAWSAAAVRSATRGVTPGVARLGGTPRFAGRASGVLRGAKALPPLVGAKTRLGPKHASAYRRVPSALFFYPMGFGYMGGGGILGSLVTMVALGALYTMMTRQQGLPTAGAGGGGYAAQDDSNPRVVLCKFQVGLLGNASDLQTDLDRIARAADTSTPAGLHFCLQESILSLLRFNNYWEYAAVDVKGTRLARAETAFDEISMGERGKLTAETLTNVDNIKMSKRVEGAGSGGVNEYIVVTVLCAIEGTPRIPKAVVSRADAEECCRALGAVRQKDVLAVEVLWQPQQEGDTLTGEEVIAMYPQLSVL